MKLYNIYEETLNDGGNIWRQLESILKNGNTLTEEIGGGLDELLNESNTVVFDKFNIEPKQENMYFISGSARLYLYPDLIAELNKMDPANFPTAVGDLDIVIPNHKLWENAGLSKFLYSGGIYRPYQLNPPTTEMNIEVFTLWDPSKTKGYENLKVRSTLEILKDAEFAHGYWFMSLADVIDYKDLMKRDKEKALAELIMKYQAGGGTKEERGTFLTRVAELITGQFRPKGLKIQKNK